MSGTGIEEEGPQDRADAWSPANGKGHSGEESAQGSSRSSLQLEYSPLPHEEWESGQAYEIKAHEDDKGSAYLRQDRTIAHEELAKEAEGGTEGDEDGREAENEGQGVEEDRPEVPPSGSGVLQRLYRETSDKGDVGGDKGQNARGEERKGPRY